MRLLILWAGIAAFVVITLFPPMTGQAWRLGYGPVRKSPYDTYQILTPQEYRVDTGCLLGHLAAVVALTGGLLWTEPQVRPWVRAKRQSPGAVPPR